MFSHGVNAGPYFDMKAKQKTDLNANGYYEFMDPWGRPYMYRAYPQWAGSQRTKGRGSGPHRLRRPSAYDSLGGHADAGQPGQSQAPYGPLPSSVYNTYTYFSGYSFYTDVNLANTTGSIQLSGFTNPFYNGTFTFQGDAKVRSF